MTGMFYLSDSNFEGDVKVEPTFDYAAVAPLKGKNVKISCRVAEARQSGHYGDAFLGLVPSTPKVGELIEIGIGPFHFEHDACSPQLFAFGIKPSDGREEFWCDPRVWYRLHDQTVELHIEETDELETPDPTQFLAQCEYDKVISNGDGTFQAKSNVKTGVKIAPNIEKIEDGLFLMHGPTATGNPGEKFDIL